MWTFSVRSGRLVYADIAAYFPDSCLIYAFASAEVLEQLPYCAFVEHDIQGGGYMLDIPELIQLANDNGGRDNVSVVMAHVVDSFPARKRIFDKILGWFG